MKVLLVSLNAKYIHSSLALRYIKFYCKDYEKNIQMLELTINHEEEQIIKELFEAQPDIIGFSCYIWNMAFIKTLIPTLRKILPHTQIVLGGPEVSYQSEDLFKELHIDAVMEGEGEKTWKAYLDYKIKGEGTLEAIEGLLYCLGKKIYRNPIRKPLQMAELPFVYEDMVGLEHKIIYYEAARGCPFNCQYCLSSIDKGVRFMPLERVKKELQYFLDKGIPQVKFVDRTFNANKNYALSLWEYIITNDNGKTNFHFEIAAELLDEDSLLVLKGARKGLIQFEIGVQSTNLEVLSAIKRKMPFEEIEKKVNQVKQLDAIAQHLDLIAGLPLEDYASFRHSFNDVMSLRPEQFQLGFLKLLKGSGLRENASEYGIIYRDEPPYEVLYTAHITFGELLKLHSIEEMVERYYNSERFKGSLEYLYTLFESPFDFYEALADFWKEKGYDKIPHKKQAYYIKLVEFAMEKKNVAEECIKELVKFDWFSHELIKDLPSELLTLNQEPYKTACYDTIKDDAFIQGLSLEASLLSPRQRLRRVHIEYFSYNIWQAYQDQNYTQMKRYTAPRPVLFDYTQVPTKAFLI